MLLFSKTDGPSSYPLRSEFNTLNYPVIKVEAPASWGKVVDVSPSRDYGITALVFEDGHVLYLKIGYVYNTVIEVVPIRGN
ncbi:MAG: hypothetical protein HYW70_02290 [Candidatus Nealsonbacteria bacterium]|nr:hypothetical protein [Candidatus Nealsonbacteria bacterium]